MEFPYFPVSNNDAIDTDVCTEEKSTEVNLAMDSEQSNIIYDGDRPLGTRFELVNSWFSEIISNPDRLRDLERKVRPTVDDSLAFQRKRKGILARRTIPIAATNNLSALFTACRDAVLVVACLEYVANMTHSDLNPRSLHYYRINKSRFAGVVYDFDHYSEKSVLQRAANPGKLMGQGRLPGRGEEQSKNRQRSDSETDTPKAAGEGKKRKRDVDE